jgi:hypothetical protein
MEFLPRSMPDDDIRELTPEEIATLAPFFTERGVSMPNAGNSIFVGAIRQGRVVAFQCLQLILHCEPVFIEQGFSHLFLPLWQKAEEILLAKCGPQWMYVCAPTERIQKLAESQGFEAKPWVILSKLIKPREPKPLAVFMELPNEVAEEVAP